MYYKIVFWRGFTLGDWRKRWFPRVFKSPTIVALFLVEYDAHLSRNYKPLQYYQHLLALMQRKVVYQIFHDTTPRYAWRVRSNGASPPSIACQYHSPMVGGLYAYVCVLQAKPHKDITHFSTCPPVGCCVWRRMQKFCCRKRDHELKHKKSLGGPATPAPLNNPARAVPGRVRFALFAYTTRGSFVTSPGSCTVLQAQLLGAALTSAGSTRPSAAWHYTDP